MSLSIPSVDARSALDDDFGCCGKGEKKEAKGARIGLARFLMRSSQLVPGPIDLMAYKFHLRIG